MSMLDSRVRKNGHWRYIFCKQRQLGLGVFAFGIDKGFDGRAKAKPAGHVRRHCPS